MVYVAAHLYVGQLGHDAAQVAALPLHGRRRPCLLLALGQRKLGRALRIVERTLALLPVAEPVGQQGVAHLGQQATSAPHCDNKQTNK
jgi:hypothetical protein